MKAWQIHELGEPKESLKVHEMDTPEPMTGQLLIEVDAVGLAFPTCFNVEGSIKLSHLCRLRLGVKQRGG